MARRGGFCVALLAVALLCLTWVPAAVKAEGWIDPDTPEDAFYVQSYPLIPFVYKPKKELNTWEPTEAPTEAPSSAPTMETGNFELVFSDEFNVAGRSFADGKDPRWTSLDKNDYTNAALHYYSPDNAVTNSEGQLVITSEAKNTDIIGFNDRKGEKEIITKHFKSAMVQSWNKFCFTGGIIETRVQLPGKAHVGGLWPAFWVLGNLVRHTYVGSAMHVWPWSSNECTTHNFYAQKVNACSRMAHYGLHAGQGRGAPEIDIFEVQPGPLKANQGPFLRSPVGQPFQSASYQAAPGRSTNRPGSGYWPGPGQWYDGLEGGNNSALNILYYGDYNHFWGDVNPAKMDYWSDAISYNRQLSRTHFNESHTYRLEWDVPTENSKGYLRWFLDGELVVSMNGTLLSNSSEGVEISTEPSSIILNTAISSTWGFPNECPANCPCKKYDCNSKDWSETCGFSRGFCEMMTKKSPEYKIDWVRVYQDPTKPEQKVGCSTPERPTRRYIDAHPELYKMAEDEVVMREVQRGMGACKLGTDDESANACGGTQRGTCTDGKVQVCQCKEGWTGPNCLSHAGKDPIDWDAPDKISDVGFILPQVAPMFLIGTLCAFVVGIVLATLIGKERLDKWSAAGSGYTSLE
mmetsp:Transcript_1951/g.2742  ORF Transcript_1951/g.2742 Transcript_1951/m.2742 type:complete len:633 (-) Transcript_1951:213-2111(-)